MKHTYKIKIEGRVQGVGFRFSAREIAKNLGVAGYVQNRPDGSVKIVASGEESKLNEFLSWCRKGPSMAHVVNVDIEEIPFAEYDEFFVR
ncbi:MAG: acylphosphatase [Bacteroidales bacterium]|nr:acylphosphatase [Bacteroidales bacterium]MCF8326834.1 acylphosphatase [Bacteroidales bacterium]